MKDLNDDEKEFVSEILNSHENVEVTDEGDLVEKPKVKTRKTPGYKKISHWISGFLILPFLLTGVFFLAMNRVQNYLGGKESLEWFIKQDLSDMHDVLEATGFGWFPYFIEIYQNKGIIIAITFTVCLVIVAALAAYDVNKNKEEEKVSE